MIIALAQIAGFAGNADQGKEAHRYWVQQAFRQGARVVFFPELSITGYEPELVDSVALSAGDPLYQQFRQLANEYRLFIGLGAPIRVNENVQIGLLFFGPHIPLQVYAKQMLHEDELPYFVPGTKQEWFLVEGHCIAPAICYESLQWKHAEGAAEGDPAFYLASVAKSAGGMKKALEHYPQLANKYGWTVLLVNGVGPADQFVMAGGTGVWSGEGRLLGRMNESEQGLLLYDTESGKITEMYNRE